MKFRLPNFPHLPQLSLEPVRKIAAFLIKHKISIIILISLIVFVTIAMWYRGYLLSKMKVVSNNTNDSVLPSTKADNTFPTVTIPTPSISNDTSVLGASNNSTSYNNIPLTIPTPFPTFAPLPTMAPLPVITIPTNTSSNSSGNSHCTTGSGVPNTWYSDVYPNPPVTTNTGSITLIVIYVTVIKIQRR